MKNIFISRLTGFVVLTGMVTMLITCKKDDPGSNEPKPPTAATTGAAWVGRTWVTMRGSANANGLFTTVTFEYDTTTAYGYSAAAIPDTMSGTNSITVRSNLTGLTTNTKYHYRVKAENSAGVTYGSDVTFTTSDTSATAILYNPDLTYGSVSDIDGNTYKTIMIGTQTWMSENLKTTRYKDGSDIPFIIDVAQWSELSAPGFCWYNNYSISNGALYNWYTVNSAKLCPEGWHVPADQEWSVLTDFLGGANVAADKLKETGTVNWLGSNSTATNISGFTAIPSGYRSHAGAFNSIRSYGYWWSSTEASTMDAYFRDMNYGYIYVDRGSTNKKGGLAVRCIMD
jgi:uncharacterized protein (TIGR02145 family)